MPVPIYDGTSDNIYIFGGALSNNRERSPQIIRFTMSTNEIKVVGSIPPSLPIGYGVVYGTGFWNKGTNDTMHYLGGDTYYVAHTSYDVWTILLQG